MTFLDRYTAKIEALPLRGSLDLTWGGVSYTIAHESDGYAIYRVSPFDGSATRLYSYGQPSGVAKFFEALVRDERSTQASRTIRLESARIAGARR